MKQNFYPHIVSGWLAGCLSDLWSYPIIWVGEKEKERVLLWRWWWWWWWWWLPRSVGRIRGRKNEERYGWGSLRLDRLAIKFIASDRRYRFLSLSWRQWWKCPKLNYQSCHQKKWSRYDWFSSAFSKARLGIGRRKARTEKERIDRPTDRPTNQPRLPCTNFEIAWSDDGDSLQHSRGWYYYSFTQFDMNFHFMIFLLSWI